MKETRFSSKRYRSLKREADLLSLALIFNTLSLFLFFLSKFRPETFNQSFIVNGIFAFIGVVTVANLMVLLLTQRFRSTCMELEKEAASDELTSVLNLVGLERALDEEIWRAGRYHYPLTLCLLDMDDFGSFNQNFGRKLANERLQKFARFVSGNIRRTDTFARFEKDSFFVVLPHTDLIRAQKFLGRLQTLVQEKLDVNFSAGLTVYQAGESRAVMIERAETALQSAKNEGRKQIRGFVAGMDTNALVTL